ncbi:MAG: hypothetical protein OXH68_18605 [Gammaproteobacteria bacterium]|nr:hypothetical protein [Gammaproteobacteria bacterium]
MRTFDTLGRATDPVVLEAWSGLGWDLFSYVGNSALSTDPTGYCYAAGPLRQVAGFFGRGGFFRQYVTFRIGLAGMRRVQALQRGLQIAEDR